MQLQDYVNDVQELLHDQIGASWSLQRVVSRINDGRLITALDMKCVRALVSAQLIQNQEIYTLNGVVVGGIVTNGGSNYGTSPTVPITFTGGQSTPTGFTATSAAAIGNLTNGSLTSITMTNWGSQYTSAPTVSVGGIGSGAAVTPITIINQLYPISITYIFNNIRTTLRYLPFTLFQAYARILGQLFASTPGAWTFHPESQNIYIQPPPNMNYQSEWDLTFQTTPLVNLTDFETQIPLPFSKAPQFAAASWLFMKDQDAGRARAQFHMQEYMRLVPKIVVGMGDVKIPNVYNRNFQRMVAR